MMKHSGFTLVEVMIVVAVVGILIAIATPAFIRARELSRQRACQENLVKIDGAKQQWAFETRQTAGATPEMWRLVGEGSYLRFTPLCPSGGTYTLGPLADAPACNVTSGVAPHVYPTGS